MLCYDMLCYAMLCYAMLCYAMLRYATLRYATLRYVTLRYVTLHYIILYYIILYYIILYYIILYYIIYYRWLLLFRIYISCKYSYCHDNPGRYSIFTNGTASILRKASPAVAAKESICILYVPFHEYGKPLNLNFSSGGEGPLSGHSTPKSGPFHMNCSLVFTLVAYQHRVTGCGTV